MGGIVEAYVDGAARGNGTSSDMYGKCSVGGYAMYKKRPLVTLCEIAGDASTNNEAEYCSLIRMLDKLYDVMKDYNIDAHTNIYMDSLLVVNQVNGKWKCKAPNLQPYLEKVKERLKKFDKVTISHIPREQNSQADRLANRAFDLEIVDIM